MNKEYRLEQIKVINDIRIARKAPLKRVEPGYVRKTGDSDRDTGGSRRKADDELNFN